MTDAGPRAAGWLSLAAAPTFAAMALLTALDGGAADMMCAMAHEPSPLTGMAAMYLLMTAFHAGPWLKLAGARMSRAFPPGRARFDADG